MNPSRTSKTPARKEKAPLNNAKKMPIHKDEDT